MREIFKQPLKIGLTGGIGAGKTTVSKIFKSLGIPVFNSDEHSKNLLVKNKGTIKEIIKEFGEAIMEDESINFPKLSQIIFTDKKKLESINNILHPKVALLFSEWLKKKKCKYIIKESALLFESNTASLLDKIILVQSVKKTRIQRVIQRDNRTQKEVERIINNQIKEKEIINCVDYIINNDKKELLVPKVVKLHQCLSKL